MVDTVRRGAGRIIDSPAEVRETHPLPVTYDDLSAPADPDGDSDGDGYTNLEEFLHQKAFAVTVGPGSR